MSKLDDILSDNKPIKHCCGQRGTGIEDSKPLIKELMLELIEGCKTASTEGGVHKIATHELRKKVEEL